MIGWYQYDTAIFTFTCMQLDNKSGILKHEEWVVAKGTNGGAKILGASANRSPYLKIVYYP